VYIATDASEDLNEDFKLFIWKMLVEVIHDFRCLGCFLEISCRENTIRQSSSHVFETVRFDFISIYGEIVFYSRAMLRRSSDVSFVCLQNNILTTCSI